MVVTTRLQDMESRFLDKMVEDGLADSRSAVVRKIIRGYIRNYDKKNGTNWIPSKQNPVTPQCNKAIKTSSFTASNKENVQMERAMKSTKAESTKPQNNGSESIQAILDRLQRSHHNSLDEMRRRSRVRWFPKLFQILTYMQYLQFSIQVIT
jgi:Arc/MetJ-type ribon-helix-helix transcriptional regulator